jgi:hypothetical protein
MIQPHLEMRAPFTVYPSPLTLYPEPLTLHPSPVTGLRTCASPENLLDGIRDGQALDRPFTLHTSPFTFHPSPFLHPAAGHAPLRLFLDGVWDDQTVDRRHPARPRPADPPRRGMSLHRMGPHVGSGSTQYSRIQCNTIQYTIGASQVHAEQRDSRPHNAMAVPRSRRPPSPR